MSRLQLAVGLNKLMLTGSHDVRRILGDLFVRSIELNLS